VESTQTRQVSPVNPIAPYQGGKRNLAKRIIKHIEATPHKLYAEAFVGMGAVFLRRSQQPRAEVINDINDDITTLFRILQRHYPQFLDTIKFQISGRAEFERLVNTNPDTLTDLERSARFLYLQRTAFGGKVNKAFTVDNDFVQANLDSNKVVIVDARIIQQAKGIAKHGMAERAGRIPGSINLPLGSLYMDDGVLKSPEELLWMLKKNGITPDKTVVTTCNTGQLAGSAFFILRYLGFENVKVHDASWVSWCDR